jgi:glycosyltransferase involved in cell wall biosynthesis
MSSISEKDKRIAPPKSLVVCHLTTAHRSDDVRIVNRECRSLSKLSIHNIILAAPGSNPNLAGIGFLSLGDRPNNRIRRLFYSQYKAAYAFTKIKAQVWHIHDPELLPIAVILILLRRKIIWDSHEDYFQQFDLNSEYRTYLPRFLKRVVSEIALFFLRFIDRHAAGIIAATEKIKISYSNLNTEVVGNEARIEEFLHAKAKFENRKLLFIGSLSQDHCFPEIVTAISNIENLELIVAGNCNDEEMFQKSKEILGAKLTYFGWVSRSQLLELISQSSLGLVTYKNTPTYNESRPTKLFEFLMSGLPVVGTPIKPVEFFLGESQGGIVSKGFESQDIESAIREMLNSKSVWTQKSRAGKTWAVKNASWEGSEKRLLKVYEQISC